MEIEYIGIFLVIMAVVVGLYIHHYTGQMHYETAAKKYHDLLAQLKLHPNDPDLYLQTLDARRHLTTLSMGKSDPTIDEEVGLIADLKARQAPIVSRSRIVESVSDTGRTVAARLRQLDELQKDGLISEAEYEAKRQKLLDEI